MVVVQNPTSSLEADLAATTRAIDGAGKNVILVGHSYGGVAITEAGRHLKVLALVYVAAFAPDAGESVSSLVPPPTPGAPPSPILPAKDGYLVIDHDAFPAAFAADLDSGLARFMADSQVPGGVHAFSGKVTDPAWKTKPSYYLIPAQDRIIPPVAQRGMATRAGAIVRETEGSHAVYISNPTAVAELIVEAAEQ